MREPSTDKIFSADGIEVAVHDYGGPGHPTIFVHGTGLVSRMWEPVMELLGSNFRPIGVDLRCHGSASSSPEAQFYDHCMVTDLVAAIDALGLSQAWVVGHSMGAATSLLATLDRPKAFEKAWVYEPIIFQREVERPVGSFDFIEAAKRRRSVFPSRSDVITRYGSRLPLNELHPSCLEAYVQHGFEQQPNAEIKLICDPILEARAFEQFLQDGWEKLPLITVPTRVAFGTDSDQQPLQSACEAIALRLPRGETNPFEGSRHFGCFGSLEKSAQSIKDWFLSD